MQDFHTHISPTPPMPEGNSPPAHDALTLTKGGPVAHICLDGQLYTLRITRAGKLILTK